MPFETNSVGEPPSLRKLRESLSTLEKLEKRRAELHDRAESSTTSCAPSPMRPPSLGTSGAATRAQKASVWSPQSPRRPSAPFCEQVQPPPLLSSADRWASPVESFARSPTPRARAPTLGRGSDIWELASPSQSSQAPPNTGRLHDVAALDAALTLALDQSQDQADTLQKERGTYRINALKHEAEIAKLTAQLERSEIDRNRLMEQRQADVDERNRVLRAFDQLREEHQEAFTEVAAERSAAANFRASSGLHQGQLELLVAEQRRRLELLQEADGQATKLSDALQCCVIERAGMLQFLAEVMQLHHDLLYKDLLSGGYHVAPIVEAPASRGSSSARKTPSPCRSGRTPSRGCETDRCRAVCLSDNGEGRKRGVSRERYVVQAPNLVTATPSSRSKPSAVSDLRELIASLEQELKTGSQTMQIQLRRILAEAGLSSWALNPNDGESSRPPAANICANWFEQEKAKRDRANPLMRDFGAVVNWAEESGCYRAGVRGTEAKFAQLARAHRVLQTRQVKKRPAR